MRVSTEVCAVVGWGLFYRMLRSTCEYFFMQLPIFAGLDPRRQKRSILFSLSIINCSLAGFYALLAFFSKADEKTRISFFSSTKAAVGCVCMVAGYVLHDLFAVLPDWKHYKADVLHHLVTLAIAVPALHDQERFAPFVPSFAIQEVSTIFLNLMWFGREFSSKTTISSEISQSKIIPFLFATSFFVTRILTFPATIWFNRSALSKGELGLVCSFISLQMYWFVQVLKKVSKKL